MYNFSGDELRSRGVSTKERIVLRNRSRSTNDTNKSENSDIKKNGASQDTNKENDKPKDSSAFVCNICLEIASDPVVTKCGHLYCWPCVHKWLTSDRSMRNTCPVCKSKISKENCIPIYTGFSHSYDRPKAEQTAYEPPKMPFNMFNGFNGETLSDMFSGYNTPTPNSGFQYGNVQVGVGLGFPFMFSFNINTAATPQDRWYQMLSQLFLFFGVLAIMTILLF